MQFLQRKLLKGERKKKSRNSPEVDFKLYIALIPSTISNTGIQPCKENGEKNWGEGVSSIRATAGLCSQDKKFH